MVCCIIIIPYTVCGINVSSVVVFASLAKPVQLVHLVKPHKIVVPPFLGMTMWWYDVCIYIVS